MAKVKSAQAREILDSRGYPTVEVKAVLEDGAVGIACIPSGASIGKYEALELRDNDPTRFRGMGVLRAVANVNDIIQPVVKGVEARNQLLVDKKIILLDGTNNKSKLGANATLAVSQAVCEAAAASEKVAIWEHITHLYGVSKQALKMPIPILNLINGGKHGAGNLDFQEFHIIGSAEKSFSANLQMGEEVYQSVKEILIQHKAIHSVGDEGGFAPNLFSNLDALEVLKKAIEATNYRTGKDLFLGLDVAPAYFYHNARYKIKDRTTPMDVNELIEYYQELNKQYPLFSLEDPIIEDDWDGWVRVSAALPYTMIVGDDLLATNKYRCQEAIERKACSAILVKPNQIGTIGETIEVVKICRQAGLKIIVSHRSGETTDEFIADLAVGVNADYTKFGAPARGERVVKYNRLLEIEKELKFD